MKQKTTLLLQFNSTHTINHLREQKKAKRYQTCISYSARLSSFLLSPSSRAPAPATIAPGEPFNVSLITQGYIQTVYDVAVAFGIAPGRGYPDSLGVAIASEYLGPAKSNLINPITFTLNIDKNIPLGSSTLSASLMSLYGAVSGPTLSNWNVTVLVGDAVSAETVGSS